MRLSYGSFLAYKLSATLFLIHIFLALFSVFQWPFSNYSVYTTPNNLEAQYLLYYEVVSDAGTAFQIRNKVLDRVNRQHLLTLKDWLRLKEHMTRECKYPTPMSSSDLLMYRFTDLKEIPGFLAGKTLSLSIYKILFSYERVWSFSRVEFFTISKERCGLNYE